jgi:hypothetical protein
MAGAAFGGHGNHAPFQGYDVFIAPKPGVPPSLLYTSRPLAAERRQSLAEGASPRYRCRRLSKPRSGGRVNAPPALSALRGCADRWRPSSVGLRPRLNSAVPTGLGNTTAGPRRRTCVEQRRLHPGLSNHAPLVLRGPSALLGLQTVSRNVPVLVPKRRSRRGRFMPSARRRAHGGAGTS